MVAATNSDHRPDGACRRRDRTARDLLVAGVLLVASTLAVAMAAAATGCGSVRGTDRPLLEESALERSALERSAAAAAPDRADLTPEP